MMASLIVMASSIGGFICNGISTFGIFYMSLAAVVAAITIATLFDIG